MDFCSARTTFLKSSYTTENENTAVYTGLNWDQIIHHNEGVRVANSKFSSQSCM
uniref:Uncharacterized protein n=1 Tax=Anguilla anguilla TaxID=7936 RepID=A0A0E9Q1X7_ANGAN